MTDAPPLESIRRRQEIVPMLVHPTCLVARTRVRSSLPGESVGSSNDPLKEQWIVADRHHQSQELVAVKLAAIRELPSLTSGSGWPHRVELPKGLHAKMQVCSVTAALRYLHRVSVCRF